MKLRRRKNPAALNCELQVVASAGIYERERQELSF